jgi:hypothetical protein
MTFEQRNAIENPIEGLMVYCTNGNADGTGVLSIYQGGKWRNFLGDCTTPVSPDEGTHIPGLSNITWNWDTVPIAQGYKWNTTNVYSTAEDISSSTTKAETGLIYGTTYTRYVWAYNDCGYSAPGILSQATLSFTCGSSSITTDHVAGNVAPVNKTVTYGTVTNIPGETSKCWITSNLGADHQATAKNDATEASSGWYWQFNRMQGYKFYGSVRTPNTTWIYPISENLDWQPANDPCALELGNGWSVPTYTEWNNVEVSGGWTDWNGPWDSALKLHAAGYLGLTSGFLSSRGGTGDYWSSSSGGSSYDRGWNLLFYNTNCYVGAEEKAYAFPIRCIRD